MNDNFEFEMYLRRRLEGHENHVASIASTHDVSEGSSRIISGAEGGEMCLWSSHDGHLVKKLKIPNEENTFMALECSKANTDIFYASLGTRILAYDLRTFDKPFHEINAAEDEINNIVINDKEKLLSIADDTGTIKIYDFQLVPNSNNYSNHTNLLFILQHKKHLSTIAQTHKYCIFGNFSTWTIS